MLNTDFSRYSSEFPFDLSTVSNKQEWVSETSIITELRVLQKRKEVINSRFQLTLDTYRKLLVAIDMNENDLSEKRQRMCELEKTIKQISDRRLDHVTQSADPFTIQLKVLQESRKIVEDDINQCNSKNKFFRKEERRYEEVLSACENEVEDIENSLQRISTLRSFIISKI